MDQDNIQWVKIIDSKIGLEVEMAHALLNDADIPNMILDKKDSAYVIIGTKELYVPKNYVVKAKYVLEVNTKG